ncbi:guanine nucleotide binding protein, alpha subunit [Mycena alexandri]|uniref:Guanine nucleotide binding protein, alpha subunit n=1 Tax=Mycena alexandri TaxID=1745969 RepID=A0AAD6SIS2_9AGAR|nr:guanine nucleotide binding protein, alpha subunit [Mycena alexandri]
MKTSSRSHSRLAKAQSLRIDATLKKDRKWFSKHVNILVLGTAELEKATLMRHVEILHGGYPEGNRKALGIIIRANIIETARQLVSSLPDTTFTTLESARCRQEIMSHPPATSILTTALVWAINTLWTDETIRNASPLPPSTVYFFDSITRISAVEFVPTDTDILQCLSPVNLPLDRVTLLNPNYSLICPRQGLATRYKWLSSFEGTRGVLFVFDLCTYDEPEKMRAAVALFDYIATAPWFARSIIHLVLTRYADLPTKLAASPLGAVYPDYVHTDAIDPSTATKYLLSRFVALARCRDSTVYPSLVDVMDADSVNRLLVMLSTTLGSQLVSVLH